MPINAHPDYVIAEKEFYSAQTPEEQIEKLKKMISVAPAHKGGENLRAQLRLRLKKLLEKLNKSKKTRTGSQTGIKKFEMQAVIVGNANSGKSSLLNLLTNANPEITTYQYGTTKPQIGMMNYATVQIQVIENPAIDSECYNRGLTNSADVLIILVTSIPEIKDIQGKISNKTSKQIIAFNKIDLLDSEQKRKLEATLKSKKYDFILISTKTEEGIEDLKGKIFQSFNRIRIYTKEPEMSMEKFLKEKKTKPVILNPGATIKDVAEKILHGFSDRIKETRIWGPSSKFSGQKIGITHVLKDNDIVEFKTK